MAMKAPARVAFDGVTYENARAVYLTQKLLQTDDREIIYDTTGAHDNEMGRCACPACAEKPARNLYGKTLMRVREALRKTDGM